MASKKIINIGIGVDLAPLTKGMKDGATIATTESAKIAEAAASAGDVVSQSNQKATTSVANLSKQFREAQRDAINLAAKYGQNSEAALAAAATAGQLKDSIGDTKKVIDAFSNDSKFTVVAGAMSAAAGSISIVTGAMGLLGTESEAVQQTMLKVQSAIALTQGIAQLKEMGVAFTALGAVINTQVIPALFTMQGALIATGIGAAVIGLGLLVNHLNQVEAASKRAADAQKAFAESNKEIDSAISAALANAYKSRELQIRAMADGYQKEAASAELSKQKELSAIKATYEASQKNFFDEQRLKNDSLAVEEYYQKQLQDIRKKYSVSAQKVSAPIQIQSRASINLNSAAQQVNDAVQKSLSQGLTKAITLQPLVKLDPQVVMDSSWASIQAAKMEASLTALNDSFKSIAQNTVVATASMLGNWIAEATTGSYNDPFEALGQLLLQSIGGLMVQLGTQMILFGTGLAAFQASISSLNPLTAIAAGAAMVAAGAAISALAAKGLQRNASGGGGGAPSSSIGSGTTPTFNPYTQNNNPMQVKTEIHGSKLAIIIDRSGRIKNR